MKKLSIIILLLLFIRLFAGGSYTEKEGRIVITASGYDKMDPAGWKINDEKSGAIGNKYIESIGVFESRKKISYNVEFKTTGRFYLFIRSWASEPADNGCYIRLNTRYPDNPGFNSMYFHKVKTWDWNSRAHIGQHHNDLAYYDIHQKGVYKLTLGVREIGAKIDCILLKKDTVSPDRWSIRATQAPGDLELTDFSRKALVNRTVLVFTIIVLSLVVSVFLFIVRRRRKTKKMMEDVSVKKMVVENAKKFMHENFGQPIKLDDVANAVNLSKGYLRTIFRENSNTTVNRYLLEYRLRKAREMLEKAQGQNIANIAYECGFENASHFTASFKDHFGFPPSEARLHS
jgi:AraC-like DNA-binding protein